MVDENTDVAIAWAAGFFDGEGNISVQTINAPRRVTVALLQCLRVDQVDPRPLQRLKEIFGGQVGASREVKPPRQRRYWWIIKNRAARTALSAMRPYLVLKAGKADAFLRCQSREDLIAFRKEWQPRSRTEVSA